MHSLFVCLCAVTKIRPVYLFTICDHLTHHHTNPPAKPVPKYFYLIHYVVNSCLKVGRYQEWKPDPIVCESYLYTYTHNRTGTRITYF